MEARKVGEKRSLSQLAENARVTLKNQNSLLYSPLRPLVGDTEEGFGKDMAKDLFKAPASAVGIRDVKSAALVKAGELMGGHQQTPEQAEKATIKKQAVKALHEGDKTPLDEARKAGELKGRDVKDIKLREKEPLLSMVKKLGAEDSMKVWEVAEADERKKIKATINLKIINSQTLDSKEKRRLREKLGTLDPITP